MYSFRFVFIIVAQLGAVVMLLFLKSCTPKTYSTGENMLLMKPLMLPQCQVF
jgi:hypothetical protein